MPPEASIIEAEEEEQNALKFVKKNYELLKSANAKIKFDMANILSKMCCQSK